MAIRHGGSWGGVETSSALPTLAMLLRTEGLRLRLVSEAAHLSAGALDEPLRWVHNSDLRDPTPFLAEDLVLLTTGTQFTDDASQTQRYVSRLVAHGVRALGFGTEVQRDGIPHDLVDACAAHGLPLFEVPYRTPFIAVARAHAEAMAAAAYARRTWALDTQRALALAALRPRGLDAVLAELSSRLGAWVCLFDDQGARTISHSALPEGVSNEIEKHVAALVARGVESSQSLHVGDEPVVLFTLGAGGALRGVLALGTHLDSEARTVVTTVIAMAGLAHEQHAVLEHGIRNLNRQVLRSFLRDDPALARQVLGTIPDAPVRVAVTPDAPATALADWWQQRVGLEGAPIFVGDDERGVVLCVPDTHAPLLDDLAARFSLRLGVSEPAEYSGFARAYSQAHIALQQAPERAGTQLYTAPHAPGLLAALTNEEARLVAHTRLAPLRNAPAGAELEATLHAWLRNDTHIERTATDLGLHRHTVRARLTQCATLLGTDLSSFPVRAELWTALELAS